MEQTSQNKPLLFAHIGDLHITNAKETNYKDFLSILIQIDVECGSQLDFVYLPGDIADNGETGQYKLVASALKILQVPVHMVAGDHDMEEGSLQNFYNILNSEPLPKALSLQGVRCIFLDVNGSGDGGPDFRLGTDQLSWLAKELADSNDRETVAIFMHTYPADLVEVSEQEELLRLINQYKVALVDMGHTHYNELANDGTTIYSATRSTGQIEEGAVGYSITSIDNGIVSWRFKDLDSSFPFVLIIAPADYRLLRNEEQKTGGDTEIRAVVFISRGIREVYCWTEENQKVQMVKDENDVWKARLTLPDESRVLTVEATDKTGRRGRHQVIPAHRSFTPEVSTKDGSDAASIGAWADNGIPGTQMGPNRNAKPIKKAKAKP